MKKDKTVIVLYILCAVLWTARVVIDIVCGAYNDSMTVFVLNVICAVMWIIASAIQYRKYRSNRDE